MGGSDELSHVSMASCTCESTIAKLKRTIKRGKIQNRRDCIPEDRGTEGDSCRGQKIPVFQGIQSMWPRAAGIATSVSLWPGSTSTLVTTWTGMSVIHVWFGERRNFSLQHKDPACDDWRGLAGQGTIYAALRVGTTSRRTTVRSTVMRIIVNRGKV